jgi:hypothetical protein
MLTVTVGIVVVGDRESSILDFASSQFVVRQIIVLQCD